MMKDHLRGKENEAAGYPFGVLTEHFTMLKPGDLDLTLPRVI